MVVSINKCNWVGPLSMYCHIISVPLEIFFVPNAPASFLASIFLYFTTPTSPFTPLTHLFQHTIIPSFCLKKKKTNKTILPLECAVDGIQSVWEIRKQIKQFLYWVRGYRSDH